jgi:hypothetical protein
MGVYHLPDPSAEQHRRGILAMASRPEPTPMMAKVVVPHSSWSAGEGQ